MALKFKCRECGEYIITKFLKVGEVAKCRNCGAENVVPENALETDEEPKDIIPTGTKPEMAEKTKGKIRPFESVLILSIITLSIYFWVYLFKTLREMKNTFAFDVHETNPDKVRPILIVYLIVPILVVFSYEVIGYPGGLAQAYATKSTGVLIWLLISTIIMAVPTIAFFSSFIKLIEVCQKKGGMAPLNKSPLWTLIVISVAISFLYIPIARLGYFGLVLLVDFVIFVVLLYLIVKQVNRIWTESH